MKLEIKLQGEAYAEVDWSVVPRCGDALLLEDDCRYAVVGVCWKGTISKQSAILEVIRVAERPGSELLEPLEEEPVVDIEMTYPQSFAAPAPETDDNHAQEEDEENAPQGNEVGVPGEGYSED